MKKIITIIGATGNIGKQTVQLLRNSGHQLRLVARHEADLKAIAGPDMSIHPGSTLDVEFLTATLKGADAALLMMPADFSSTDHPAHQDAVGLAQIAALQQSGVKKVLFISSVGAHTEEKTGVVAGLARQENRLKALNLDLLILRPSYFMENLKNNIGMIQHMHINGGAIRGDKAFPIIATRDIASVVASHLTTLNWSGVITQPLLGPKDYTLQEVTAAIGKAIGQPELPYVTFSYEQAREGMLQAGLTPSLADGYIGLSEGINDGVFDLEVRNHTSTTPTTIEEFAETVFKPAYLAQAVTA